MNLQDIGQLKLEIIARVNQLADTAATSHASVPFLCRFISIDDAQPEKGQAVWVRHRNGAEYRLTYPFKHDDYPLWYPLPNQ